jgi:hypothetical protein
MAEKEIERLFVVEVGVGIANMDLSTGEGVVSDRVVVQQVTASDGRSDETRELLLIYRAEAVDALAEELRTAAQRALADGA